MTAPASLRVARLCAVFCRVLLSCAVALATVSPALAQDGAARPSTPAARGWDTVPGVSDSRSPRAPRLSLSKLDDDERLMLQRGEIGDTAYVLGGLAATGVGFGLGHSIQGRWSTDGWYFTAFEPIAYFAGIGGVMSCAQSPNQSCNEVLIAAGLGSFLALRVYETVDAWVTPPLHNATVRRLRTSPGHTSLRVTPYLMPSSHGNFTLGASLTF